MGKTKRNAKKSSVKKSASSTQLLERAVKAGTRNIAHDAKVLMGYTSKELNGWVVREYLDGRIEKVSKIIKTKRPSKLVLD